MDRAWENLSVKGFAESGMEFGLLQASFAIVCRKFSMWHDWRQSHLWPRGRKGAFGRGVADVLQTLIRRALYAVQDARHLARHEGDGARSDSKLTENPLSGGLQTAGRLLNCKRMQL
jgi:hypothetical protein